MNVWNSASLRWNTIFLSFLIFLITLFYILTPFSKSYAIDAERKLLPNGLLILHSERHNLPIVRVTLLIKASPFNETPERAGLANLTAALLVEGTNTRSSEKISEEIEFIGAMLDTSVDRDYTTMRLSVLKKYIDKGFELFSDCLLNPTYPEEEIKREIELIKGNLRQREEDPVFIAEKQFREALYGKHPYGRLIVGTGESLDQIQKKDIVKFYKTFYRPNNAILSVVGDLSAEELTVLVNKYLSQWKEGEVSGEKAYSIPELKDRVIITVDRELTQANIILGHTGIRRSNPDYYAVSVMNYILGGGGFASRLMDRIRDDMGLAYDVQSSFISGRDRGPFEVVVQTKNESAKTVIDVVIEEIRKMQNKPVSDVELRDAKSYLTGSFPRRLDTMEKIAIFLTLTEFYSLGIDYDKKYSEYINSATKEDILRVARKYLNPETYILTVVADMKKTGILTKKEI